MHVLTMATTNTTSNWKKEIPTARS